MPWEWLWLLFSQKNVVLASFLLALCSVFCNGMWFCWCWCKPAIPSTLSLFSLTIGQNPTFQHCQTTPWVHLVPSCLHQGRQVLQYAKCLPTHVLLPDLVQMMGYQTALLSSVFTNPSVQNASLTKTSLQNVGWACCLSSVGYKQVVLMWQGKIY